MTSKFTELAIDCADPGGLARFWCSVLDYEVQDADDGIVTIGSPMVPEGRNRLGPVPPTLTFARVPEGKTIKNRLHLDVNPTDREQGEEVRRLLGLGARHADVGQGSDVSWVVLADPEGNEFCVLADRCPRLLGSRGEDALGYDFAFVEFTCRPEPEAPVEAFRAVLNCVVGHRQPVLSAPHGLLAQGFDCESSITVALMLSTDIQPPQVAMEKRVLILRGKCGHDEANQLVTVIDQAGPRNIGHRVRVGQ